MAIKTVMESASDGDAVTLIKDLKVKGSSLTVKRGTVVKKIRSYDEPKLIAISTEAVCLELNF